MPSGSSKHSLLSGRFEYVKRVLISLGYPFLRVQQPQRCFYDERWLDAIAFPFFLKFRVKLIGIICYGFPRLESASSPFESASSESCLETSPSARVIGVRNDNITYSSCLGSNGTLHFVNRSQNS